MTIDGLPALRARIKKELEYTAYPDAQWVPAREDRFNKAGRLLDVLIVGAGQAGQTIAFNLKREGVNNIRLIDQAAAGREGPWLNYARMETLRSPKQVTGPDLGLPALTFQAWYEAQFGEQGWQVLDKIAIADWAAYLMWLRQVLVLPVENGVRLEKVSNEGIYPVAILRHADGNEEIVRCRKLILAHGIEASGQWWTPPLVRRINRSFWAHTSEMIKFAALGGKRVAVLGAGASAMDNAATALEAGAATVDVFCRRPELQRIQPFKWLSYAGFFRHFHKLDDAMRWRFMAYLLDIREAFPKETWQRCNRHQNFTLHTGAAWQALDMDHDQVKITSPIGRHKADFLIIGTGFEMDLNQPPELAELAADIALWSDSYSPPPELRNDRLGAYPYLDDGYRLQGKRPGETPVLNNIHLFTYGATMSFGPSGASINAMKFALPHLVNSVTQDLFTEDADIHLKQLMDYRLPEFLLPGEDEAEEAPSVPVVER